MRTLPLALLMIGCTNSTPVPVAIVPAERLTVPGLENVFRLSPTLYCGGAPEGEAAFDELKKLGITTVISVDGMSPDVELATRHGMTTIHLPVGYNGINTLMSYKLAKAVQVAPGPVYLHCHHGRHRGPTAIAVVRLCLELDYTPAQANAWLEQAGLDPGYKGLVQMPNTLVRPTEADLAAIPAEFPSKEPAPELTKMMLRVDQSWQAIREAKAKEWLGVDRSAIVLAEDLREATRTMAALAKGAGFATLMLEAENDAKQLAADVRASNWRAAEATYLRCQNLCKQCHASYRD